MSIRMTSSTTPAPQLEFGSAKDQAHLFLWKYPDFESDKVMTLLADFARFTSHGGSNSDYLDEFQTCRLFEYRGETQTASEMRKTIQRIINATTKKIGFLELCCAIFHKPMTDFTFSDPEVRREALAMAVKATKEAEEAAARLADLKEKQEMEKIRHEEELEEESKLSGVKAKAAFFKRRMVIDEAAVNEKKIKQEAALRQAVKKAKMEQEEAIRMAEIRQKTAEEVEKEVLKARKRAEEIEAAAEAARVAEEKLKREERKEELNNVWKAPVETKLEEPLDDKAARALRKKMLNAKWEKALTTKDMNSCNN